MKKDVFKYFDVFLERYTINREDVISYTETAHNSITVKTKDGYHYISEEAYMKDFIEWINR